MSDFSLEVSDLSDIPESLQPFYKQDATTGNYIFSAVPQTEHEKKMQALKTNAMTAKQKAQELARLFGVDDPDTPNGGRTVKERAAKLSAIAQAFEEKGIDMDSFPELLEKVTAQQQGVAKEGNPNLSAQYEVQLRKQQQALEAMQKEREELLQERNRLAQKETFRNARDKLNAVGEAKGLTPTALSLLSSYVELGAIGFEGDDLVATRDISIHGTNISAGTDLSTMVESLSMQNIAGFLQPSKGTGTTSVSGSDASQRQTDMQAFTAQGWNIDKQFEVWQKNPSMYDSLATQAGANFTGRTASNGMKVYSPPIKK